MSFNLFDDMGRPLWQKDGKCNSVEYTPDLFFPDRGASTAGAKAVCAGCPVKQQCLEYALMNGEKFGIWGGESERDRRKIKKRLNQRSPGWRKRLKEHYGLK